MLFNSIAFILFYCISFLLFFTVCAKKRVYQNLLIFVGSCIFYGWWDWRFLSLLLISCLADYYLGIRIASAKKALHKKLFLCGSLSVNLGILCFFKYFNFFMFLVCFLPCLPYR